MYFCICIHRSRVVHWVIRRRLEEERNELLSTNFNLAVMSIKIANVRFNLLDRSSIRRVSVIIGNDSSIMFLAELRKDRHMAPAPETPELPTYQVVEGRKTIKSESKTQTLHHHCSLVGSRPPKYMDACMYMRVSSIPG
jgi:hypothetical protein